MTAASQTVPDLDYRQVEGLSDVLVQRRCGHHRRHQHGMAGRERRRRVAILGSARAEGSGSRATS
jgi:hypothetical protein